MDKPYHVRCPDCGSLAIRTHLSRPQFALDNSIEQHIMQTECPSCDYLMNVGLTTGNLIDVYTTNISAFTRRTTNNYQMAIADRDKIAIVPRLNELSA